MTSRRTFIHLVAASAATSFAGTAFAQQWPNRPIRAIVPFSAGSSIDVLGRLVAEPLAVSLGQPIVIDNRGGAGGSIGTAVVAKAEPDGHTLLIHASAHSAAPAVYPNLAYSATRDIAAVANFGVIPNVLVISPAKGIKSARQFADFAKKGSTTYASAGVGSASHWGAERFRLSAGYSGVHVPFKGGIEALTDVMAGRVDIMSVGVTSALPFIKEGRLIPLAVSTRKRSSILPDVPTTLELGFADSDYIYWNGLFVPGKTPRTIVDRLHAATMKVLSTPATAEKLKGLGVEPMPLSPKEFDAMIAKEVETNIALAKAAGLKFN